MGEAEEGIATIAPGFAAGSGADPCTLCFGRSSDMIRSPLAQETGKPTGKCRADRIDPLN
jgi:hypothetical protein